MTNIEQIGKNIRAFREKLGITQRTLSERIMVSFQAISAWELAGEFSWQKLKKDNICIDAALL